MKLSRWTQFKVNLSVAWRIFKEWLHSPVCWTKGHCPTMLEDNETIYCERCGKVLGGFINEVYVKKGERLPSAIPEKIAERGFVVKAGETKTVLEAEIEKLSEKTKERFGLQKETPREQAKKLLAEVNEEIRLSRIASKEVEERKEEISKEEAARKRWLPKPTTRRRTRTHTHQPPAERHRGAISKHMGKKGGGSKHYRRTIRESSSVPIEEDD